MRISRSLVLALLTVAVLAFAAYAVALTVTTTAGTTVFTPGQGPVLVDSGVTVSDGSMLTYAEIRIANHVSSDNEMLTVDTLGYPITWSYCGGQDRLALNGSATAAQYQAVLRTIRYDNTTMNPNTMTRSIQYVVQSGTVVSPAAFKSVTFGPQDSVNTAPTITVTISGTTFTVGKGPVVVESTLALNDDGGNISSATVSFANRPDGASEVLAVGFLGSPLTASYNATTGVLIISGTDTAAHYQQALRTVTYNNTSAAPTMTGRTIYFSASDGVLTSPMVGKNVAIVMPPAPTAPTVTTSAGATVFTKGGGPVLVDDHVMVTNDGAMLVSATVTITNSVDYEYLAVNTLGYPITASFCEGRAELTLSGTATTMQYQNVLRTLTYNDTSTNPNMMTRTIQYVVSDGAVSQPATKSLSFSSPAGENSAPTVPVLQSPASLAEVTTLTPALSLLASTDPEGDAITYSYEVYADAGLAVLAASAAGQGTSWTVAPALSDNSRYYWRALATDGAKNSLWTSARQFIVNTLNTAPSVPVISSPADGAQVAVVTPVLSVTNASDLDPNDIVTYDFEVHRDSGCNAVLASAYGVAQGAGGTTSFTSTALADNAPYTWRARARDQHGAASDWVTGSFFVNTANDAPSSPLIVSPAPGAEVGSLAPALIARYATDRDGDSLSYFFEIDSAATFDGPNKQASGAVAAGATSTAWTPAPLADNTTYFWRVKASDGQAASAWASGSFFVNTANDAPSVPTAGNPSDNGEVTVLTPVLKVNPASDPDNDALTYEYRICSDSGLMNEVAAATGAGTAWTATAALADNTRYWWTAQARDEHGTASGWTAASSFFVNNNGYNDPPTIALTSPAGPVEAGNATQIAIAWTASDPDSDPEVTLWYDLTGSGEAATRIGTGTFRASGPAGYDWDIAGLADGTYYLYAKADDGTTAVTSPAAGPVIIDRTAPVATISGAPAGATSQTGAVLVIGGAGVTAYRYTVDNGPSSAERPVSDPITLDALAEGPHAVSVVGRDNAGNWQLTPTAAAWTVDTIAPDTSILDGPADPSLTGAATISFAASEPGSSFECRIDGGAFVSCSSPRTYSGLADGAHLFEVRAVDAAGNVDPTPARSSWLVVLRFTVTPVAGDGGRILPGEARTVDAGETLRFRLWPNIGYRVASVTGCNGTLRGHVYFTGEILSDCTVTATFEPITKNKKTIRSRMGMGFH